MSPCTICGGTKCVAIVGIDRPAYYVSCPACTDKPKVISPRKRDRITKQLLAIVDEAQQLREAKTKPIEELKHDFSGEGWEIERSIQDKINQLVTAVNELRRGR